MKNILRFLFSFQGRAARRHVWIVLLGYYCLFLIPLAILLSRVPAIIPFYLGRVFFFTFYPLALWIAIAVQVKRFHDFNQSGYMVFVLLIPLVNVFFIFRNLFFSGTDGLNEYGPKP